SASPSPPQAASELTDELPTVIVDSAVGLSQADRTGSPADTAPAAEATRRRRTARWLWAAAPRGNVVMAERLSGGPRPPPTWGTAWPGRYATRGCPAPPCRADVSRARTVSSQPVATMPEPTARPSGPIS